MTTQVSDQDEDVPATPDAEVDREAETAAPPPAEGRAAGRRGVPIAGVLALALAIFAAAAAGFLWWQYRQFYVALASADGETQASLREVRAELRGLEDRIGEASEARAASSQALERLTARVDTFPARFADLDEKLAAAQGVSVEARGRWLRAQAEYYLTVANAELNLRGSRGNAIAALELADQALLDAGNPAYAPVRQRLAGDLQALRAVRLPDVEGLSYSLGQLAGRISELPMRMPAPDAAARGTGADEAEPGLGRLWQSFKNALGGMFRIERSDATAVISLSRDQQILVRRQVELELTLARFGLVQAMPEVFATSLAAATSLLREHFDTEQASVEGAVSLLQDMRELDVAPRFPDISGALTLLRNLADRDG